MTLGDIIKQYRHEKNLSMDAFAERSGISKSYISMLEKNENPRTKLPITPTTKTLESVSFAMGITVLELLDKINERTTKKLSDRIDMIPVGSTVSVRVVGTVRAGYGGLAFESDMGLESVSESSIAGYNINDFFYLRVKGDSMEPRLYENDLVLVRAQSSVDSGSYAVVTIDDEEGVVKIVQYDDTSITLISQNHNYPPRVFRGADVKRIRVIGKVIESKSKF